MRGIRAKDTRPELQVRRMLHAAGFRYRLHVRELPGTPDLVLPRFRAAIFVSGCFWHGHDCRLFRIPATRTDFWLAKIERNRQNDRLVRARLVEAGWRHATVWECALRGRSPDAANKATQRLSRWLRSNAQEMTLRD